MIYDARSEKEWVRATILIFIREAQKSEDFNKRYKGSIAPNWGKAVADVSRQRFSLCASGIDGLKVRLFSSVMYDLAILEDIIDYKDFIILFKPHSSWFSGEVATDIVVRGIHLNDPVKMSLAFKNASILWPEMSEKSGLESVFMSNDAAVAQHWSNFFMYVPGTEDRDAWIRYLKLNDALLATAAANHDDTDSDDSLLSDFIKQGADTDACRRLIECMPNEYTKSDKWNEVSSTAAIFGRADVMDLILKMRPKWFADLNETSGKKKVERKYALVLENARRVEDYGFHFEADEMKNKNEMASWVVENLYEPGVDVNEIKILKSMKSYKSGSECIVGLVAKMERKNLQCLSCADTLTNNKPLKLKAL